MDYLVRGIAASGQIRAFACTTRDLTEHARAIHNLSPIASAALGRLMAGSVMMGAMLKSEKDILTLRMEGAGPMKGVLVTADSKGNVKGYVSEPAVILPPRSDGHLDVGGAIGAGFLSVIKDLGLKEPYVGQTILQTGEIAEDLTYYFATSEQVPSSVGLGVLMNKDNTVRQAGGFIVQLMPFCEDVIIDKLEEKIKNLKSVTTMLDAGMTPEDMLNELLGDLDLEILDQNKVQYSCNCSKERFSKGLISIGAREIKDIIKDNKPIEVNCHFCNSNYEFTIEELKELLKYSK